MKKDQSLISHQRAVKAALDLDASNDHANGVHWMKNMRPASNMAVVSANELTSLSALIAYVAYKTGKSEFQIERNLADRFSVPNVTRLPSDFYDEAIHFLVATTDFIRAV